MPQEERENEALASSTFERILGEPLQFVDLTGGVDYRSLGRDVVFEVTRFTNPLVRAGMTAAAREDSVLDLGTGYDWHITFAGYPRYPGLQSRLYMPLHDLEAHGLGHWDPTRMGWWASGVPTLKDAVMAFGRERVIDAVALVPRQRPARLFISVSGGWEYAGPDDALTLLESAVAGDDKHLKKLRDPATQRHLWLWTDTATVGDIRRALSPEEDRLPSRPPQLPAEVTHVWCVDEDFRRGWMWGPDAGWQWVTVTDTEPAGSD